MSKRPIIGVMGPGESASPVVIGLAVELGRRIAEAGWVTLSGGRNSGVMDAVNQGAKQARGLTVGILPTKEAAKISAYVDVPVITDMGSARNNINVLSSDVLVACGMGRGTAAEVALGLKADKNVILLASSPAAKVFFQEIGGDLVTIAQTPDEAIETCKALLEKSF